MNSKVKTFLKKYFVPLLIASSLTLFAYIALYALWGAVLSSVKSGIIRLVLIALMTEGAFGFLLLLIVKVRHSVGEDEVVSDYKEQKYTTMKNDLKLVYKHEKGMLLSIAAIVGAFFVLNSIDSLIGVKLFSLPAFFFIPMCLFGTVAPVIGYVVSILVDCFFYLFLLLIYRKRRYRYWNRREE